MKTAILLFASLLLVNNLIPQSPEESPELKEASALIASASKLSSERKYEEALSQAKKALVIREKLLPRTDERIVASLAFVADMYLVLRDYGEAKKYLERVLQLQTERTSPGDASLASTMDRLAVVYYRQGDKRKTEDMYQRALAAREKAFGAESARVADSLFNLGEFYRLERDFDRAASSYRRSLLIYGKLSGIKSKEFESARDGYYCLAHEKPKLEVVKDLKEIEKQFAPPQTPDDLLGTRVLNGMALSLPKPDYSAEARARHLSGIVIVKVEIDETGRVSGARDICQGPPYLSEAAVASALKARFTPTKLSGVPMKVKGFIVYRFVRL